MNIFLGFLAPNIGSDKWQLLWTLFNTLCLLLSILGLTAILLAGFPGKKNAAALSGPNPPKLWGLRSRQGVIWLCVSCAVHGLFPLLLFFKQNYDPTSPFNWLLDGPYGFLNLYFDLDNLLNEPFANLPGGNTAYRILWLCAIVFTVILFFRLAFKIFRSFCDFLDGLFELRALGPPTQKTMVIRRTVKTAIVLIVGIIVGGLALNAEETKDYLQPLLKWVPNMLSLILEIVKIPENPDSAGELIYRFFVMILSISIFIIYAFFLCTLAYALYYLFTDPKKIIHGVRTHGREIGRLFKFFLTAIFALSVVFVIVSEYETIRNAIVQLAVNGPQTFVAVVQSLILLALKVLALTLLGYLIVLVASFAWKHLQEWIEQIEREIKRHSDRINLVMKFIILALCALLLFVLFFVFYDQISAFLIAHFGTEDGSYGFGWVLRNGVVLAAALMAGFFALIFMGGVVLAACLELIRNLNITDERNLLRRIFNQTIRRFFKLFDVIAFVFSLLRTLIMTIMRVFTGYRTESQKNNAVFVAATFASLASLLNTYLGLYDFNRRDDSIIPMITSLAISFAVQLAMLIFGMKAGQSMAENLVMDSKTVGTSIIRVIWKKVFACVLYLLGFASILTAIVTLYGNWTKLFTMETAFPSILICLSGVGFAYGIVMQILDICYLWKNRRGSQSSGPSGRGAGQPNSGDAEDFGILLVKPKRIPARYYFIAYILLMIVSTGFAFNNLFGCYADQINLHNQVYDQIRIKTDASIHGQLNEIIAEYNEKNNQVLSQVNQRIEEVNGLYDKAKAALETAAENEGTAKSEVWYARVALSEFETKTKDFPIISSYLKSLVSMDYDSVGAGTTLTVYTYDHYLGDTREPGYSTSAMRISSSGNSNTDIGTVADETPTTTYRHRKTGAVTALNQPVGRYVDPDSAHQTITIKKRVIENATKYDILEELLILFESTADVIETDYVAALNETVTGTNISGVNTLLQDLQMLDNVRLSMAKLCLGDTGTASMLELPRIADAYLAGCLETAAPKEAAAGITAPTTVSADPSASAEVETAAPKEAAAETTAPTTASADPSALAEAEEVVLSDKKQAYKELAAYIDGALNIYNVLDTAQLVLDPGADPSDPTDPGVPTDPGADAGENSVTDDLADAEQIRQYRNYAQGITQSNFQISYDTLLHGAGGMNSTGTCEAEEGGRTFNIDALYTARIIAWFILLICLLVDFMAFFAGLLLFQDAFLLDMKNNKKLSSLGYVNFEALLTNYFTPNEEQGADRRHQLALIYHLLYSNVATGPDERLIASLNVNPQLLKGMIAKTEEFLKGYQLDNGNTEFHAWLLSFVQRSGITFEEILLGTSNAAAPAPAQNSPQTP